MAVVAKWLTHWIVAPTFVGSIPINRPIIVSLGYIDLFFFCDGSVVWRLTCLPVTQEIAGSIPVGTAMYGSVAQSVEQRTENPRVGGSIPSRATFKNTSIALEQLIMYRWV